MDNYLLRELGRNLKKNRDNLRHILGRDTDVMRVYDREFSNLDFIIELYANYAVVKDYSKEELSEDEKTSLISVIASNLYIPKNNIIYKYISSKSSFVSNYTEAIKIKVKESSIIYNVELAQKIDTGIFLDNFKSRLLVRELSFNQDVLNLFAYTGGYSVNAAYGGAKSVVSVDTSQTALDVAKLNMEENGFVKDMFMYIKMDVKEYLKNAKKSSFDLIVFDAPSFSNGHKNRRETFDVQRDHVECLILCARLLKKGGIVLFRTALSSFKIDMDNLKNFRVLNYTAEMVSPGFSHKHPAVKTFALRLLEQKKIFKMKKRG